MDESPPLSPSASSRPSFSSFWKRTKEAASAATRQVTFVPIVPRIGKDRNKKRSAAQTKNQRATDDEQPQDVSWSSTRNHFSSSGGDQGEAARASGEKGGSGTGSDEDAESVGGGPQQRTAKEKAQIRRAQVRRAQIQHRKRKADYMRQLELDIDMLRDLITAAEQDMRTIQKDNEAIRVQLGIVTVIRNDRGVGVGAGVVAVAAGRRGGGGEMDLDNRDAMMADVPQLSITPAPPAQSSSTSTSTPIASVDSVAASLSPLSFSSTAASTFHSTTATSPGGTVSSGRDTLDSRDSMDSPTSIFDSIDLDDITVSIVMDEAIGNPVYQISSLDSSASLSPEFIDPILSRGSNLPAMTPVSPFDPGFDPTFNTDLAADPATSSFSTRPDVLAATAYILPNLTVAQTHQVVNFVLALEHVCWGHAGHQFHDPNSEICADGGHAMMATNLFLREAPGSVFTYIESSAKDMGAFVTNKEPENPEATAQHMHTHQASQGITWQASDITLQTLYGLAVSLNPISVMELTPVQAWFELAARFPLSILLRPDVLTALKREFVGVVRCLYFGAVMEREAFESVVHRVVEPVMDAEDKAAEARALIGASPWPALMPSLQTEPTTVSPHHLTINVPTTTQINDFASSSETDETR